MPSARHTETKSDQLPKEDVCKVLHGGRASSSEWCPNGESESRIVVVNVMIAVAFKYMAADCCGGKGEQGGNRAGF